MASRLDFSQIRSLYIGTSAAQTVPTNNVIVDGNILIGTTTDAGYKLDVNGTGRFNGQLRTTQGGRTLFLGDGAFANHINIDSNVDFAFNYNNGNIGGFGFFAGGTVAKFFISNSGDVTARKIWLSTNGATDATTAILANASTNDSTSYAAIFGSLNAGYRMVVRADGNVGIGTNEPETKLHIVGLLQIRSSTEGGPHVYRDNDNAPDIRLYSTAGTFASPTAKSAEGLVGQIHWAGYDGGGYVTGANVFGVVDGAVGANVMPTRLEFRTTTNQNPSPRLIIKANGNVLINTTTDNGRKLNVNGDIFASGEFYSNQYASARYIRYNWNSTNFTVGAGTATRWVIGRIYWNQVHWGGYSGMDIEIVWNYYNGARKKYSITNGAGGGSLYLRESQSYGSAYGRITLGSAVDTGTTSGGYTNYYQDVYLEVNEYNYVSVNGELKGPTISIDKTSIGGSEYGWATFFSSPSASTITMFNSTAATILTSENNWGYIDNRLGINVSNPDYQLDVYSANTPVVRISSQNSSGVGNPRLLMSRGGEDTFQINVEPNVGVNLKAVVANAGYMDFYTGTNVVTMRLSSSKNVLIGTTTDLGDKLHVIGNAVITTGQFGLATNTLRLQSSSGDTRSVGQFVGDESVYNTASNTNTVNGSVAGIKFNWYSENWMISATRGGGADIYGLVISRNGTERLVIGSGGNVGIGTVTPLAKLHVSNGVPTGLGTLPANTTLLVDNGASDNFITIRNTSDNGTYGGFIFQDNNVGGYIAFRNYTGSGPNDGSNGDAMYYGTYTDHIFQAGTQEPVGTKPEIMRIKYTGNVLIGTTTDAGTKLYVYGNIRLGVGGSNDKLELMHGSGFGDYGAFRFYQAGTEFQTIHSFSTNWQGGTIYSASTGSINLNGNYGVTFGVWYQPDAVINTGGNAYFRNNVLIGTTTDNGYKLYVNGTGFFNNVLRASAANTFPIRAIATAGGVSRISFEDNVNQANDAVWVGSEGYNLCFGSNFSEQARISSSGNLIIGSTTDAGYKLDVYGEILGRDDIRILNTYALVLNGTDNNWRIGRNTITDSGWLTLNTLQIVVFGGESGQGFQVVNHSGTALFEINGAGGASRFTNSVGVGVNPSGTTGRIDASNDIVAYSTSDQRLKENITPIANALDKVKALTGVEFDWKEDTKAVHGYEGHDVGVIAQEVQAVLPEAVRTNDSGYLSVRYEKMIALLVEANKELASRVEELEKKLK